MAELTSSQKTYLASQKTPDDLAAFYRANGLNVIDAPTTGGVAPSALGTPIGNEFTSGTAQATSDQNRQITENSEPDAPSFMDWETAFNQAKMRVNPTYDSLRTKYESAYADQRQMIPQLLAARYGMSGTRGGRRQSSEYQTTQKENAALSDIESQRLQAQNQMAEAIQNQDWDRANQLYQNQMNMYKTKLDLAMRDQDRTWAMTQYYTNNLRNDAQNALEAQRYADETAYNRSQDALENDWKERQWNYNVQQDLIKNALKNMDRGGNSTSSGVSSDKGLDYNTALIRATALANADPRLSQTGNYYVDEAGNTYYSLPQLIDAYMTQIAYDTRR